MTKNIQHKINISFGMLPITVVLAILKLSGVWDLSWWLVFLPILIPFAILAGILLTLGCLFIFASVADKVLSFNYKRFKYLMTERVKKCLKRTKSTSR